MRKFNRCVTFVFLLIVIGGMLSACSSQNAVTEPNIEEIALTTDNYQDYLCVNTYVSDCFTEQQESGYNLFCQLNVSFSSNGNFRFKDCRITLTKGESLTGLLSTNWNSDIVSVSIAICNVDYYGNGHSSLNLYAMQANKVRFPNGQPDNIKVSKITGVVIIEKEK